MRASLAVCSLTALLALGSCLQCEVCAAVGNSCTGAMETCASGQDSCAIALTETTTEQGKIQTIGKGCALSSECKTSPLSMNFGKVLTSRTSIACCMGDACKTTKVLPADTKPNGYHCPGCYMLKSDECGKETIECGGAETQCITFASNLTTGGNSTQMTMTGCASESICANFKMGLSLSAQLNVNIASVKCTAASSAMGVAPQATGLLLSVLTGLLLLKCFS